MELSRSLHSIPSQRSNTLGSRRIRGSSNRLDDARGDMTSAEGQSIQEQLDSLRSTLRSMRSAHNMNQQENEMEMENENERDTLRSNYTLRSNLQSQLQGLIPSANQSIRRDSKMRSLSFWELYDLENSYSYLNLMLFLHV